jgi:CO/xanthine dehydrogenase Mo-binding subunit
MVGATAAQSIYYFPKNDLAAVAIASRAIDAGSARGYGTLQSMAATEMMVDEMAAQLGIDPIAFRLKNALRSGMKNTQGAVPAGAIRVDEVLQKARAKGLRHGRRSIARKGRIQRGRQDQSASQRR